MSIPTRIDTHQHCMPDFYAEWLRSHGIHAAGGRRLPEWSPSMAEDFMAEAGIAAAVISISTPGTYLGDAWEARQMARRVNQYLADVSARHPTLGFFAVLPLPDVEGAILEAAHALDTLGADGVLLLANVDGTYLGAPAWEPLMAELQARQAVVFVHPSELPCPALDTVPPFVADFLLDTTRAAIQYAQSGALERYPDVKVILSHAGGFVPYAAERIARVCSPDGRNPGGLSRLRQFYYDTALSGSPYAMPSLQAFADPSRILFGSDWPFADRERALHFTGLLDNGSLTEAQRRDIHHRNALALFPRLSRVLAQA